MTTDAPFSLLDCAVDGDREFTLADYAGGLPRWCPGCGDHSVLTAAQRLLADERLLPERTIFVSGIGCSSRFPHYLSTYGFHGLHGRALPIATGVALHRPDLHVFVVMGDGDCCSIGAAHWIHAVRYNMNMTALLLDNGIYGLTKKQMSPTTPLGVPSNTALAGPYLPPLDPLQVTLGVTNASFVAQTAEWIPSHVYETLKVAFRHRGFSFVRILQRCPAYLPALYTDAVRKPSTIELLVHEDGVPAEDLAGIYTQRIPHDPRDIHAARRLAEPGEKIRLGVFFRDESLPRYDDVRRVAPLAAEDRIGLLEKEFDRYAI